MAPKSQGLLMAIAFLVVVWGVYAYLSATSPGQVENTARPWLEEEPGPWVEELPPPDEVPPEEPRSLPPGAPVPARPPETPAPETQSGVRTISRGEEVDLQAYAVAGKSTIFDFYSDYCPPCRAMAPRLEALANRREDIVVVKVDINRPGVRGIDWQSPVSRQHNLRSIPHIVVYDANRQMVAEGNSARGRVEEWMAE